MSQAFGSYIRERRESLNQGVTLYSIRRVAKRMDVQPCYLSKIEREQVGPPAEKRIHQLSGILGENADTLLAKAGKVSSDLKEIILKRPVLMAEVLRKLDLLSDGQIAKIADDLGEMGPTEAFDPDRPASPSATAGETPR
jgi:transcriptional regulator with XRE-family HTH domain